jgi:hypothetical protein
MKGKILSVLFSLMLVFGMIIAACDNGAVLEDPTKDDTDKSTLDFDDTVQGKGERAINHELGIDF